jgi:hypothetical protein
MRRLLAISLFSCLSILLHAQAIDDYRSNVTTGNWGTAANWQRFNGTIWVTASSAPSSTNGAIEIRSGHSITIPNSGGGTITADQITINGTLTINTNAQLLAGVNASFLIVNGILDNNGGAITASTSTLVVNGTLNQNSSGSTITGSAITFQNGSTFNHKFSGGALATATWNTGSTCAIAISTNNPSMPTNVNQNFHHFTVTITSGTGTIANFGFTGSSTISGNFTFSSSRPVTLSSTGYTLQVNGDFTNSGAGTVTLTSSGTAQLNLRGNFTQSAGSITTSGTGNINFSGSGVVQSYSRTGLIPGLVNFSIASGAIVDFGTNTITGTGTFALSGEMRTGISTGLNGTLANSGTKTFNSNSTITYNGSVTQAIGTTYPANPASGINVTINNSSGVVNTSATTTIVTGTLSLQSGTLTVAAGQTLQLDGTVSRTSGSISANGANLTINGSGSLGVSPFPFSGDQTINNLIVNRPSGTITLQNNITLNNGFALTLTSGTLSLASQTLTLNGNAVVTSGLISGTSSSTFNIGGNGTLSTFNFAPGGNILGTLNVNRSGAAVAFGGDFTISNTLNITIGTLSAGATTITMQGTTWTVDDASGGIFSAGTGLVIFDAVTSVTYGTTANTSFNNIQLNAGRTLSFPSAATVRISGNIDFDSGATFDCGSTGVVFLNGASTQTFNGGSHSFNNITVNKSGGNVTLTGIVNLKAVLDVQSNTDFQSNGNLTLVSTADDPESTGSIAALLGTAGVSGSVNVQRFISAEGTLFRYIGSPLSNTSVSNWIDDFAITGNFSGASTTDPVSGQSTFCGTTINSTSPSLYYYKESSAGSKSKGYVAYPPSLSSPITPGLGYSVNIRETCFRTVLIDASGPINNGPISLPVTFTPSTGGVTQDGWNLVSNPYPSAIYWGGAGWTRSNVSSVIDVTDNASGSFITIIDGETIAQGQAFWIKADGAGTPVLNIDENAKVVPGASSSFYRVAKPQRDLLKLNLTKGNVTDFAFYRIVAGSTATFDKDDFPNQNNRLFDVATLVDTKQVAVNSVPTADCGDVIAIHVRDMTIGTYSFNVNREGVFENFDLVLKDKMTGTFTNLSEVTNYSFEVTSKAASRASNRFVLELRMPAINQNVNINSGNNILCGETNYQIQILNPQAHVSYFAEIDGVAVSDTLLQTNGALPLSLMIDKEAFTQSENLILIHAFNYCGQSLLLAQNVLVSKQPLQIAHAESKIICRNGSVLLVATGNNQAETYNWYDSEESSNPLSTSATYQTPTLAETKMYYVSAVNALGCEGPRYAVTAEVTHYQDAAISILSRNRFSSNSSTGNQWYYNDQIIERATNQTITATKSGTYRVDITANGCTTSAALQHSLINVTDTHPYLAYPNPLSSTDDLHVEILAEQIGSVQLINSSGTETNAVPMSLSAPGVWSSAIDMSGMPNGLYYLHIFADSKSTTIKVLKIN